MVDLSIVMLDYQRVHNLSQSIMIPVTFQDFIDILLSSRGFEVPIQP